jgi:hypothetical protein
VVTSNIAFTAPFVVACRLVCEELIVTPMRLPGSMASLMIVSTVLTMSPRAASLRGAHDSAASRSDFTLAKPITLVTNVVEEVVSQTR